MSICDSCGNLLDVKMSGDSKKKKQNSAIFHCPTCGKEEDIREGTVIHTAFYLSSGYESSIDPELIVDDPTNEFTIYHQCTNKQCKASKNDNFEYTFTVYKDTATYRVYYICQECLTVMN